MSSLDDTHPLGQQVEALHGCGRFFIDCSSYPPARLVMRTLNSDQTVTWDKVLTMRQQYVDHLGTCENR